MLAAKMCVLFFKNNVKSILPEHYQSEIRTGSTVAASLLLPQCNLSLQHTQESQCSALHPTPKVKLITCFLRCVKTVTDRVDERVILARTATQAWAGYSSARRLLNAFRLPRQTMFLVLFERYA